MARTSTGYDRGIVSLAERANCPLMWSHYGDQHRGVCFGYSVPKGATLEKVRYGGARTVQASLVAAMLDGMRKRRSVSTRPCCSRRRRTGATSGNGGSSANAAFAVARALEHRDRNVRLYEIGQQRGAFQLKKVRMDIQEALATLPRRSLFDPGGLPGFDRHRRSPA